MNQRSDIRDKRLSRKSLGEQVAAELIQEIINGSYEDGVALPSEAELADRAGVSRLTMREAMKVLRTDNVVRVQPGRGTFINPTGKWTGLRSLVMAENAAGSLADVSRRLIEARRLIEVNVAAMAAERSSDSMVGELEAANRQLIRAHEADDVNAAVDADLAFHQLLMDAVDNVFISALVHPLRQVLKDGRYQTSRHPEVRQHAIEQHRAIIEAIAAHDSVRAAAAMDGHMDQTLNDLEQYILPLSGKAEAVAT